MCPSSYVDTGLISLPFIGLSLILLGQAGSWEPPWGPGSGPFGNTDSFCGVGQITHLRGIRGLEQGF